jgi:hypothetical protein
MNGHEPEHRDRGSPSLPERARQLFELSVTELDAAAGNRLRLLRRTAVSEQRPPRRRWPAAAATGAAAALLLGLAWWRPASAPTAPAVPPAAMIEHGELLLEAEDDDAELYAWLGDAPVAVETARGAAL